MPYKCTLVEIYQDQASPTQYKFAMKIQPLDADGDPVGNATVTNAANSPSSIADPVWLAGYLKANETARQQADEAAPKVAAFVSDILAMQPDLSILHPLDADTISPAPTEPPKSTPEQLIAQAQQIVGQAASSVAQEAQTTANADLVARMLKAVQDQIPIHGERPKTVVDFLVDYYTAQNQFVADLNTYRQLKTMKDLGFKVSDEDLESLLLDLQEQLTDDPTLIRFFGGMR